MVLRAVADHRRDVDGGSACYAEALSKVYGTDDTAVHALRDVTLDIPRRSFTAVMGPSGSGKSTLLHCLAALDTPTSGRVFLGDTELTALSRRRQARLRRDRIGFVFQAYNLVPTLDALENITLPQLLAGRSPDHEWLDHVISRMGLGDRIHHRPNELSGGQQQRIALARALAGRPEVIFADEPTGNLDTTASSEMLTLLRDAVDQFEQTVVTVTHDPTVARYADQILQFSDGRVIDRHDRRAVGEGSDHHHDSDVAGSGGPDHRGPADTPPRPDGQHTMRSRRRRQPGEPNPGRPMVGSDDEVEVARQERWLQRIREQFEAEQDSDAAFDQGPGDAGVRWDDPPVEQPPTRPTGNAARRRPQYEPEPHPDDRSHEASAWQEQQARADDDHLRAETDADGYDTRRRFRTPPPSLASHQSNGAATNGYHRHPVELNRDPDAAAPDGSRTTWNDRDADRALSTGNGTWGATDHAAAPTDGGWLPPMRSWVDDGYADEGYVDDVPAHIQRDHADAHRHHADTYPEPADTHQHHADTYPEPADTHQHHANTHPEPADTHQHPTDSDDSADPDQRRTDGYRRGEAFDGYGPYADPGRHSADHDDDPADTYRTVRHDDPDATHQPTPQDQVDAPWSRPETGPLTSTAWIGSSSAGPDHDTADPWAPSDARKAEEYRTEQGAVRRGSSWSHDSGDLSATARFDRDAVQAAPSTPEEADTVVDAPSYGPSPEQGGPGHDSTDRPDQAIHEPATPDLSDDSVDAIDEPTTGGDAAPAVPGATSAGDDSDRWISAWDDDTDPALDEVWMPTFGHQSGVTEPPAEDHDATDRAVRSGQRVPDANRPAAPADAPARPAPRATSDDGDHRVEPSAEPVDEPTVPGQPASLRNTRRAEQADDARAALESLQQQLDRLSARAGRRGGARPRPGAPRGTDRRPPG